MDLKELEARIRVLEDIEAIKKLKATYCYLCDAGLTIDKNREELVSHFTKDARVDFGLGPASQFQGTEGMHTFFGTYVAMGVTFCMHMVHNPIIEVKGDKATGRWYYEAPTTDASTGQGAVDGGHVLRGVCQGEWRVEVLLHWDQVEVRHPL